MASCPAEGRRSLRQQRLILTPHAATRGVIGSDYEWCACVVSSPLASAERDLKLFLITLVDGTTRSRPNATHRKTSQTSRWLREFRNPDTELMSSCPAEGRRSLRQQRLILTPHASTRGVIGSDYEWCACVVSSPLASAERDLKLFFITLSMAQHGPAQTHAPQNITDF